MITDVRMSAWYAPNNTCAQAKEKSWSTNPRCFEGPALSRAHLVVCRSLIQAARRGVWAQGVLSGARGSGLGGAAGEAEAPKLGALKGAPKAAHLKTDRLMWMGCFWGLTQNQTAENELRD